MTQPAIAHGAALDFTMPTLADAFRQALSARPDGHFLFIGNAGEREISYAQIWDIALRMLHGLQASGAKAGDVFILDAAHPESFIPALWAVMLGGMVAVPFAGSHWNSSDDAARLESLTSKLENPAVLSDTPQLFSKKRVLEYAKLRAFTPVEILEAMESERIAVLIPTSGTTGRSQLVSLSARAIMHRWWSANPAIENQMRFIGWTPLDHVMGLGIAGPNYQKKIYLPPELFVRAPQRWLELVEKHRITHAVMTNFGMKLLAESIAPEKHYDLSSILRIGIGAEMISPRTCTRFTQALMRFGMPNDAIILGYGLSECGPVAGGQQHFQPTEAPDDEVPLPIDLPTKGHAIRITNDNGLRNEGEHGRIEVRGATMASGYYGDEAASAQLFTADGWLRTGDIGYLREGRIHITGREKETLSINAKKFPCEEIDAVLRGITGVEFVHIFPAGHNAAALVYGTKEDASTIEAALRKACVQRFGFGPSQCIQLEAAQLPRTPSGKLQRHRLVEFIKAPTEKKAASGKSMEEKLQAIMARFLPGQHPAPQDNFFELGGDSLGALMFTVAVESELGVSLPPAIFTQAPSCHAIAQYLQTSRRGEKITLVNVQHAEAPALFLTPGMWGNNAYAAQFSADMGSDIPAWTFHLTDPANREQLPQTVGEFAAECAKLIRSAQPQGPYHLAGHSFGGLLAFEIARNLQGAGLHVGSISIIDSSAQLGAQYSPEPQKRNIFVIDQQREMAKRYMAEVLDCPVNYFRAKDSPYLTRSDISGGWSYIALQGVNVIDIDGDHQTIIRGASRASIANCVRSAMQGKHSGLFVPPAAITAEVRALIDAGRRAAMLGDQPREIELLRSAIAADSTLPFWIYGNLARSLFGAGRIEEAASAYSAAVQRDEWKLSTYRRFAKTLRKHDLTALGREVMETLANIPTDDVAASYSKATVYSAFGDTLSALKALREGLTLVPRSLELRSLLAHTLVNIGKQDEACEQIRLALTHPMENDIALLDLGVLAIKLKDYALAALCMQQTLAVDPYNPDAHKLLGQIEAHSGNVQEAARLQGKAALLIQGIRLK